VLNFQRYHEARSGQYHTGPAAAPPSGPATPGGWYFQAIAAVALVALAVVFALTAVWLIRRRA
jgi:succinate dehydrogenase hydrophobic anchor subunit